VRNEEINECGSGLSSTQRVQRELQSGGESGLFWGVQDAENFLTDYCTNCMSYSELMAVHVVNGEQSCTVNHMLGSEMC
jgi:hypothetical protein